ncbi:hypothetical protein [Candidatus Lariskella endosymbiont of Epinotia ramella]
MEKARFQIVELCKALKVIGHCYIMPCKPVLSGLLADILLPNAILKDKLR